MHQISFKLISFDGKSINNTKQWTEHYVLYARQNAGETRYYVFKTQNSLPTTTAET